jgi:hypothetical protein
LFIISGRPAPKRNIDEKSQNRQAAASGSAKTNRATNAQMPPNKKLLRVKISKRLKFINLVNSFATDSLRSGSSRTTGFWRHGGGDSIQCQYRPRMV